MPRRRRHLPWLAALVFLLGFSYLIGPILIGGRALTDGDLLFYYFPMKSVIRRLFLSGQSLAWNPFIMEGQPLAANPEHEIFYPFTWLLFVMPVRIALNWTIAAHFGIAYWGTLRFLRRLRFSGISSIFGAACWCFGGLFVSSTSLLPVLYAWSWIPWLAEAGVDSRRTGRLRLRAPIFAGLIALIGEPVCIGLGFAIYAATLVGGSPGARKARSFLLTAALALGLAAVTLIPGAALAKKGARGSGLPEDYGSEKSFPPLRFSELLLPRATGNYAEHRHSADAGWRLYREQEWPFFAGLYAGGLLIPLAIVGIVQKRRRVGLTRSSLP